MADFTDDVVLDFSPLDTASPDEVGSVALDMTGNLLAAVYYQRIYDNNLDQYVYYTLDAINASPDSADTVPNHSGLGNLLAPTHEIIEERLQ